MNDTQAITIADFITKHNLRFECHRVDSRPDGLIQEPCTTCTIHKRNPEYTQTIHGDEMRHWRCRIIYQPVLPNKPFVSLNECSPRSFGLYFSQGSAHTEAPTLADVLDCLASDISYIASVEPTSGSKSEWFQQWAIDMGYDVDSRKAEKTFKAIKRQAEQLKRVIGTEAYQELLWNTERL